MKWINHILIAGSLTAAVNPVMIPVAVLGSTAPDWLEWVFKLFGKPVKHRTVTHYVTAWLFFMLFGLFVWDFHGLIFWFAFGGFTHVMADSLTVMGVPLGWWSDRRFHLFGGRLRTGQMGEYFVSGGVVVFSVALAWGTGTYSNGFVPFFFRWDELYKEGVIDAYEWKQNRFKWI